jgi:acetyl esterase/lipase
LASIEFKTRLAAIAAAPGAVAGLADMRAALEAGGEACQLPNDVEEREALDAPVPGWWYVPESASEHSTAVLYAHGGGYVSGSARSHRGLVAQLARHCGLPVLSVGYRLAPEHRYPCAHEDFIAAHRWLVRSRPSPGTVVWGGDSAGAGLVMTSILALREAAEPLPAGAFLFSPWVDLTLSGSSMDENDSLDPMVGRSGLGLFAKAYLGDLDPRDPAVAPLSADLSGLPPLFIQVGDHEALLDDARRLADRVHEYGGSATLEVWPEMVHVWQTLGPDVPEAVAALRAVAGWLASAELGPPVD